MHKLDFCYILHFIKHNTSYFLKIELSHHIYGKFVIIHLWKEMCLTYLDVACKFSVWLDIMWCDIVWFARVMRCDFVWFARFIAKTNCSPGGTLGVHGRNPSQGSAWSARPAEGFGYKYWATSWILAYHLTLHFYTHIHSFI